MPAFIFCGNMLSGYGSHETTGAALVEGLEACHAYVLENFAGAPAAAAPAAVAPTGPEAAEPEAAEVAVVAPEAPAADPVD